MGKVTIEIDCKFDRESFVKLLEKANEEMAILSLTQDVKHTYPSTALLVGMLNGSLPKDKVKVSIRDG